VDREILIGRGEWKVSLTWPYCVNDQAWGLVHEISSIYSRAEPHTRSSFARHALDNLAVSTRLNFGV